ncbi:MAG: hypothetical protein WBX01_13330 [Nitrososphaeraceae archaeon]|jgi:hypothetical protein
MENGFKMGLLGLIITVLGVFTLNGEFSPTGLQGTGYEQNNDEHSEYSCGNGILPEKIPCKNLDNNAKGEKNNVNIEGIVFP